MPPEVLSVEQAQAANLGGGLSDEALEAAILEEEAWLARRIGPLTGERTQRFPLAVLRPTSSEVHLKRPTDSVEVLADGTDISAECELRPGGWVVARLPEGTRYAAVVEVTYTPTDELEVRRALRQLLALTLTTQASPALAGETMGSYSYQRATGETSRLRQGIVRSLQEPSTAGSTRLRSGVAHGTAGQLGR